MDLLPHLQGPLIGLLGWAATGLWALGADRLSDGERRAMIVCAWLAWMLPGAGTLVLAGLFSATVLMIVMGVSTVVIALALIAGAQRWRTKP
jgi:hypothetical protein